MIKFINAELFEVITEDTALERGGVKTKIVTADGVIKKNIPADKIKKRTVATVISPTENIYGGNVRTKTKLYGNNNNSDISALLEISDANKYDADVYLIAYPFNGFIKPIEESKQFRIRKGCLVASDHKSIKFGDQLYTKVLYLIVEPNIALFNEDHKYHTDSIDINITSYMLDTQDGVTKTLKTDFSVSVTGKNTHTETWNGPTESEPIDKASLAGTGIYKVYIPDANKKFSGNTYTKNTNNNSNYRSTSGQYSIGHAVPSWEKINGDDEYDTPTKKTGNKGKSSKKKR